MKLQKVYEADDGQTFYDAESCKKHEDNLLFAKLVGLTDDDVDAALSRKNIPLADAFERAGNIAADARRADGQLRHKSPKKKVPA